MADRDDLRAATLKLFADGHLSAEECEVVLERIGVGSHPMAEPTGPAAPLPPPVSAPPLGGIPPSATQSAPIYTPQPVLTVQRRRRVSGPWLYSVALLIIGAFIVFAVARAKSEESPAAMTTSAENQVVRADEDLLASANDAFDDASLFDGSTDTVEIVIDEYDATGFDDLETYLQDLGFPPSVYLRMGKTRALDGTQRAETENVDITWTYHPDDGLQVVVGKKHASN